MSVEVFGQTPSGDDVRAVRFSGDGVSACLMEWGATLLDLRLDGVAHPLTLGFDTFDAYQQSGQHIGAIAGRFAGRIAGGYSSGERWHPTTLNNGQATLHGGLQGFGVSLWRLVDHGPDFAMMELTQPDQLDGFSGAITAQCRYQTTGGALHLTLTATADQPTVCNLAQHSYFNLSGAATIDGHQLMMNTHKMTPLDDNLLPTGKVMECPDDLIFDSQRSIGATKLDSHFVLANNRRSRPIHAATLIAGDIQMQVETTEPGLVVYTGDKLPSDPLGIGNRTHGPRSGICLECQLWPDAPNQPHFPSAELVPGQTYRQETVYHFAVG